MFQKLCLFFVVLILSACTPSAKINQPPVLPDDLKDCKFYEIVPGNGTRLQVVRCPNSQVSTTYKEGKSNRTTAVIDGETYEKKE